jgi:hypothetical protein
MSTRLTPSAPRTLQRRRADPLAAAHALRRGWRELSDELFERDGLSTVFQHARNVLSGAMIVAAGLYAAHHLDTSAVPFAWTVHFAGHVVALIGALLLLLNLCDGLRRLAKRRHGLALRIATIVIYVALTVRLTQVIVVFRIPT